MASASRMAGERACFRQPKLYADRVLFTRSLRGPGFFLARIAASPTTAGNLLVAGPVGGKETAAQMLGIGCSLDS